MQGRRSLQGPCHPISLVLPKETGVTPQRKAPVCDWRHSAPQCGAREITTWSSRMVNDVSHQNRALLPLVAALTGKLMRPSPRSGALSPHAVWPRAKRSLARSAMRQLIHHSGLKLLPFRGPLGRAMRPGAAWSLESEGFLFDKTKRNLSEGSCREPNPCIALAAPWARRYATGRSPARSASGRRPACKKHPPM